MDKLEKIERLVRICRLHYWVHSLNQSRFCFVREMLANWRRRRQYDRLHDYFVDQWVQMALAFAQKQAADAGLTVELYEPHYLRTMFELYRAAARLGNRYKDELLAQSGYPDYVISAPPEDNALTAWDCSIAGKRSGRPIIPCPWV